MKVNTIIVDDFYNDPDQVREFALNQDYNISGNYPGKRTKSFLDEGVKNAINSIMQYPGGGVTDWFLDENGDGYTGSFQLCSCYERTWIHSDHHNMWAGVCYLSPDAPLSGGTALYRHKESGDRKHVEVDYGNDASDITKWEVVDRIGNIYNRLILYPGKLFHSSIDYFGTTTKDSRLIQTFFFNTNY